MNFEWFALVTCLLIIAAAVAVWAAKPFAVWVGGKLADAFFGRVSGGRK